MVMRLHIRKHRRAVITFELLVAAGLLVCMIGVLAPLTARLGRMMNDGRHVRIALSELSNQIDVLTTYDRERLMEELESLTASEEIRHALPGAKLQGEVKSDGDGTRLILTIDWERPVKSTPLSLVAWLDGKSTNDNAEKRSVSALSSGGIGYIGATSTGSSSGELTP